MSKIKKEGIHDVVITAATIQESNKGMSVWITGKNRDGDSATGYIHLTNTKILSGPNKGKTLMFVNLGTLKQIANLEDGFSSAKMIQDLTGDANHFIGKSCSFTMSRQENAVTGEIENQVDFVNPIRQSISEKSALDIFAKMGGDISGVEKPTDKPADEDEDNGEPDF